MYPRIHPLRGGGEDGGGILYTYSVLLPTLCIYMHMKKCSTCYISGMHVMYLGTSINTNTNSSMQCISSVVLCIPMYSTMYPYHPLNTWYERMVVVSCIPALYLHADREWIVVQKCFGMESLRDVISRNRSLITYHDIIPCNS